MPRFGRRPYRARAQSNRAAPLQAEALSPHATHYDKVVANPRHGQCTARRRRCGLISFRRRANQLPRGSCGPREMYALQGCTNGRTARHTRWQASSKLACPPRGKRPPLDHRLALLPAYLSVNAMPGWLSEVRWQAGERNSRPIGPLPLYDRPRQFWNSSSIQPSMPTRLTIGMVS